MNQSPGKEHGTQIFTTLRFLAALGVIAFHYGRETPSLSWTGDLLLSGHQMVTFFFVLSGFVLTLGRSQAGGFWRKRLARIAPVYLLALVLCLPFLYGQGAENSVLGLTLSSLGLQAWVPDYALSLNRPAWSISVELFFYALFPWLSRRSEKQIGCFALSYWALSQALIGYGFNHPQFQNYPSADYNLLFYWPPTHLGSFLMGIWAGKIKLRKQGIQTGPVWLWASLILLTLGFRTKLEQVWGYRLPLDSALHAPLFAALLLSLSQSRSTLKSFLEKPGFLLLGSASYSLYILQEPLAMFFLDRIGERPQDHFWWFLAFCLACSLLSYLGFEKPLRKRLGRQIS